jgi:hypothetical protein
MTGDKLAEGWIERIRGEKALMLPISVKPLSNTDRSVVEGLNATRGTSAQLVRLVHPERVSEDKKDSTDYLQIRLPPTHEHLMVRLENWLIANDIRYSRDNPGKWSPAMGYEYMVKDLTAVRKLVQMGLLFDGAGQFYVMELLNTPSGAGPLNKRSR